MSEPHWCQLGPQLVKPDSRLLMTTGRSPRPRAEAEYVQETPDSDFSFAGVIREGGSY